MLDLTACDHRARLSEEFTKSTAPQSISMPKLVLYEPQPAYVSYMVRHPEQSEKVVQPLVGRFLGKVPSHFRKFELRKLTHVGTAETDSRNKETRVP